MQPVTISAALAVLALASTISGIEADVASPLGLTPTFWVLPLRSTLW